jgi:hypothetical protein
MNKDRRNNRAEPNARDMTNNRLEQQSSVPGDLRDSKNDRENLQPEESRMDLPDVKDIPGQEFANVPPAGEMADTTAASDDEEGRRIFDETEDLRPTGNEADVRRSQKIALEQTDYMPTRDEDNLNDANMDNVDFQNTELNERAFNQQERTGDDLDVPGSEDQTRTSSMGQGDEENQYYSLGGADNDNVTEGTP